MSEAANRDDRYFVTDEWVGELEGVMLRVAKNQLIKDFDAYRLLALAAAQTLMCHYFFSDSRASRRAAEEQLLRLFDELSGKTESYEFEALSLEEMTVASEMTSTAFALIAHRRDLVIGCDADLSVDTLCQGLITVMRTSCEKGGARSTAALSGVLEGFLELRSGTQPLHLVR
ncbi:MAG: hypothetical protein OSB41_08840 [Kiritimatiellae bacterium]|nr:hypothetical protein [Kiritimatiellia bacterium]